MAKKPRHEDLVMVSLLDGEAEESSTLCAAFKEVTIAPKRVSDPDAFIFDDDDKAEQRALEELRGKMQNLKIVARAKVTQSRIYSAAYHPEASKDLIFFGGRISSTL
jgi:WD repeat-containing protein 76